MVKGKMAGHWRYPAGSSTQTAKHCIAGAIEYEEHTSERYSTKYVTKGVISEDDLLGCSESGTEDSLREQGMVSSKRITIASDGKEIMTRKLICRLNCKYYF